MARYIVNDENIINVCKKHINMAAASRELEIPFSTFVRHAKRLGIYKPNPGGKGYKVPYNKTPRDVFLNEILVKNSRWNRKGQKIKKFLIEYNLKEDICEVCGQTNSWNNKFLVLQLDHINGIKHDNRLKNLRIICPNCHTQTKTFSCRK